MLPMATTETFHVTTSNVYEFFRLQQINMSFHFIQASFHKSFFETFFSHYQRLANFGNSLTYHSNNKVEDNEASDNNE